MTRVFISYSHDSEGHRQTVLDLAQRLRDDGIHCEIDQFIEGAPRTGWQRWMREQITGADFVLIICTPRYKRLFEGREPPGEGHGVDYEGIHIVQQLYKQKGNDKFVSVVVTPETGDCVPDDLQPYGWRTLPMEYEQIYRRITRQPAVIPRPVGKVRELPPDPHLVRRSQADRRRTENPHSSSYSTERVQYRGCTA
jgi:hypothetical protein